MTRRTLSARDLKAMFFGREQADDDEPAGKLVPGRIGKGKAAPAHRSNRTRDCFDRQPSHGSIAAYARCEGVCRLTVSRRLKAGLLVVGAGGRIEVNPLADIL